MAAGGLSRSLLRAGFAERRAFAAVGLALALALNLALAAPRLADAPLDFDESATANVIDGAQGSILDRVRAVETNGPVYFWAVALWSRVAGMEPGALRAFSLLAGLLGVAGVGLLGAARLGPGAGALAALLAATSPYLIFYEMQARFYAPIAAWAVLSTALFLRITDRPTLARGLAYGLVAGAGGAAFTLAFALPAAHLAVLLAAPGGRRPWRPLFAGALAVAAVGLIELPLLREQLAIVAEFWIPEKGWAEIREDLYQLGGGAAATWILLFCAGLGATLGVARPRREGERFVTLTCVGWALVLPVGLAALSALGRPSILGRYAAPSVPALWLLAGSLLSRLPLAVSALGLLGTLAATLAWRGALDASIDLRVDYGRTFREIQTKVGPDDAILYTSRFHFLPARRIHPADVPCFVFEPDPSPRLRSILGPEHVVAGPQDLAGFTTVWVVHQQGEGLGGRPPFVPELAQPTRVPPAGLLLTPFHPEPR